MSIQKENPDIEGSNVFRLVLAGNLIDTPAGDSTKLDKEDLREGTIESLHAISLIKPKVVICLQKDVYDLMYSLAKTHHEEIQNKDILKINSGTPRSVNYEVPLNYFKSEDELWSKWILTRTLVHPSRSNFCKEANFNEQFLQPLRLIANKYFSL